MALLVRDEGERIEVKDDELEGVEDGDPGTTYVVRPLTQRVIDEIRQRHTRQVINKITHRKDAVTDDRAMAEDLLDYLLMDWSGVLFKTTRQPVPCTKDYKVQALAGARVEALFKLAGVNEVERAEVRAASFPSTPGVG